MRNLIFVLILILVSVNQTTAQQTISDAAGPGPEEVVRKLYELVTFKAGETPDWELVKSMFIKDAVIVLRSSRTEHSVMSREGFVDDFKSFIIKANVGQTGFTERVINVKSTIFEDIAQFFVVYDASIPGSERPPQRGLDSFELLKTESGWKIVSIVNELPKRGNPIPEEFSN